MFTEEKRIQLKYARDQAKMAHAFETLRKISRDYSIFFGVASSETYADGCKIRLLHAYEALADIRKEENDKVN